MRTGESKHFASQHNRLRLTEQKPVNQVKQCVTGMVLHLQALKLKGNKEINQWIVYSGRKKAKEIGSIFFFLSTFVVSLVELSLQQLFWPSFK